MTTLPVLNIIDLAGKTLGTVKSGGTIYQSDYNVPWTLEAAFSQQVQRGYFWLDTRPEIQQWSYPMICTGKPPLTPANLSAGFHALAWAVQVAGVTEPHQYFAFTVAPTRPSKTVYGWNLVAANDPRSSPVTHPELLQLCKDTDATWVRDWLEEQQQDAQGLNYYTICRQWATLSVNVFAVWQFQSTNYEPPTDAQLIARASSFPEASSSGIKAIGFNECSSPTYFKGTMAQLAHVVGVIAPILIEKGYMVVAPSFLNDTAAITAYADEGGYAPTAASDFHSYQPSGSGVASNVKSAISLLPKGGQVFISEFGTRPTVKTSANWAAQQVAAIGGIKGLGAIIMPYSAFPEEILDQACPLNLDYSKNPVYYPAYVSAMTT